MSVKDERQLIYSSVDYKHSEAILAGLYRQFNEGTHCDMVVQTSDGEIHTHRCLADILFTKASIFASRDGDQSRLDVGDCDHSTIMPLVEMMYTGTLSIVPDMVTSVRDAASRLGFGDAEKGCMLYMSIQEEQIRDATKSAKHPEILIKEEPPDYDEYSAETSLANNNNNSCRNNGIANNIDHDTGHMKQSNYCSSLNLVSQSSPTHVTEVTRSGRRTRSRNSTGNKTSGYMDLDEHDIDQLMQDDDRNLNTHAYKKQKQLPNAHQKRSPKKSKYCVSLLKSRDTAPMSSCVSRQRLSGYELPHYISQKDKVQHVMLGSRPQTTIKMVDQDPECMSVTRPQAAHVTTVAKGRYKATTPGASETKQSDGDSASQIDNDKVVTTEKLPFSRVHNHHGINFQYTYSKKEIKVKKSSMPELDNEREQPNELIKADELNQLLYGENYKANVEDKTDAKSKKRKAKSADSTAAGQCKVKVTEEVYTFPKTKFNSDKGTDKMSTARSLKLTEGKLPENCTLTVVNNDPLPCDGRSGSISVRKSVNDANYMKLRPRTWSTMVDDDYSSDSDSDSSTEPIEVPDGMKYVPNVGLVPETRDTESSDDEPKMSGKILGVTRKKLFLSHIAKQKAMNQPKYVICHPIKPVVKR